MKTRFAPLCLLLLTALASNPSFADGEHGGHGGSDHHGHLGTPPPQSDDQDEVDSEELVAGQIAGMSCDQAGEALRKISNRLLALAHDGAGSGNGHDGEDGGNEDQGDEHHADGGDRWQEDLGDAAFLQDLWSRLAAMYRACGRSCFDDGVAVGQISAAGYCAASIATGGLADPGVIPQPPLPLCQNEIFIGCQSGYRQTAASYSGCQAYETGAFQSVFSGFISQDCHL